MCIVNCTIWVLSVKCGLSWMWILNWSMNSMYCSGLPLNTMSTEGRWETRLIKFHHIVYPHIKGARCFWRLSNFRLRDFCLTQRINVFQTYSLLWLLQRCTLFGIELLTDDPLWCKPLQAPGVGICLKVYIVFCRQWQSIYLQTVAPMCLLLQGVGDNNLLFTSKLLLPWVSRGSFWTALVLVIIAWFSPPVINISKLIFIAF